MTFKSQKYTAKREYLYSKQPHRKEVEMFRAYEIDLDEIESLIHNEPTESIYKKKPKLSQILSDIKNTIYADRKIFDGQTLLNTFFPNVECPVFLSHSGKDLDKVRQFAHWLRKKFEINAFIDSDLWEGIEKLQDAMSNDINDKAIPPLEKATNESSDTHKYNIKEHTLVMLCHALTRTIDSTECFIFLKSSNSATKDNPPKIFSPWIFYELATIDTIIPKKQRTFIDKATKRSINEAIECEVLYPPNSIPLQFLTIKKLKDWASAFDNEKQKDSAKTQLNNQPMSAQEFYDCGPQITKKLTKDINSTSQYKNSKWAQALDWLYENTSTEEIFPLQKRISILLG